MKFLRIRETPAMFWQTLLDAGLVEGDLPANPATESTPWFVKAMLGVAAWLSCLFFLFFVASFMGELFRNAWARAILGIIACALATFCFRKKSASPFLDQMLFILALLGQALVLSAIFSGEGWEWTVLHWLCAAVFETAVLVAIPYLPNRFLSAFGALLCLYGTMFLWSIAGLFMPLSLIALAVVLHRQWQLPRLWPVVALGLCLAPFFAPGVEKIVGLPWYRLGADGMDANNRFVVLERVGLILVWLGVVYTLLKQVTGKPLKPESAGVWLLALLLAAGTWAVPLALFALAVFFLGFSQRDRLLEGLGIAQLLWSVGHYYYALEDTLLFKSLTLSLLGIALLLLYAVSRHLLPKQNEGEKV